MKIGLIDEDGHNYPNLPLMKLSAWHKSNGDSVEWYSPFGEHYDIVYCSKVFSFSSGYEYAIDNADEVIRRGSGYCIKMRDGKEFYDKSCDNELPDFIGRMFPDYSLYNTQNAYGFITRGCPRGCSFCIVGEKEGRCSRKVADIEWFYNGQKRVVLMDANFLAYKNREYELEKLAKYKTEYDFNQGLDLRFITRDIVELFNKLRMVVYRFAWDRVEDEDLILKNLDMFLKYKTNKTRTKIYVLTNYNSTFDEDLYRVETLKSKGVTPYVMVYDKQHADRKYSLLQQYTNSPLVFNTCASFKDFDRKRKNEDFNLSLF